MKREITSYQRLERRIPFRIVVTGGVPALVVGARSLTVTDTGVGDYLLTLREGAARAVMAIVCAEEDSRIPRIGTKSVTSVQILVDDLAGSPAEGNVAGEIIAWDSADETGLA